MNRAVHSGTPASPGTALGFAFRTDRPHGGTLPHRRLDDPAGQITEAFGSVARRMRELADSLRTRGQCEQADIMEVAGHIAADNDLRVLAIGYTEQGDPTTVAIKRAVDSYATMLASLDDPMLAERATDVRQIGRRALAWLHGDEDDTVAGPLVLLAHEIGAADLLEPHAPVVAAASVV
jgi:phosphoenolpyruvate-protein kinase (PTS system EI component)